MICFLTDSRDQVPSQIQADDLLFVRLATTDELHVPSSRERPAIEGMILPGIDAGGLLFDAQKDVQARLAGAAGQVKLREQGSLVVVLMGQASA